MDPTRTLECWITQGQRIGYEGEKLQSFADSRLARVEKKEAERIDREERAKKRELKVKERELENEKETRKLEIKRLTLTEKRLSLSKDGEAPNMSNVSTDGIMMPKMPIFFLQKVMI